MTVLITGVSGLVGRHTAAYLIKQGFDVLGVSRNPSGIEDNLANLRSVDLLNPSDLEALPSPESIIHCAAVRPEQTSDPEAIIAGNITATNNLLRFAKERRVKTFVFCSTMAVVGQPDVDVVNETAPISNPGLYGACKLTGEYAVEAATEIPNRISLRLPSVLGDGATDSFLPSVYRRFCRGELVTLHSLQSRFNNVVHVEDLTTFFATILRDPKKGYALLPVASHTAERLEDVIEQLSRASARAVNVEIVDPPSRPFLIDDSAARASGYQSGSVLDAVTRFLNQS